MRGLTGGIVAVQGTSRSQGWMIPKRTSWWCTASVCGAGALLGDLLGVSRSVECEFLSVLSYHRFIFSVFAVNLVVIYSVLYFRVCLLFRFNNLTCQYLDWLERLL